MPIIQPATTNQIPVRPARSRRAIAVSAAIASLALLAAGCGGTSPGGSPPTANGVPPKSIVSAAFKNSSCMRDHGVPNVPDPQVINTPGQQGLILHLQPSVAASPQFKAAQKACRGILPAPGNGNVHVGESPQQMAEHLKGVLGFARCMRSHSVPSFPDPNAQGELSIEMVNAAGIDLHAPAVQAAARACVSASDGQITAADVYRALNSAG